VTQTEIGKLQVDIEEEKQFLEEAKKYLHDSCEYLIDSCKKLLVRSKNANEANKLLDEKFPDYKGKDFGRKLDFLKTHFTFSLAARYTTKEKKEDIDREDYFATLQYLISEARDFGVESVIKKNRG
jgi:hypothetical protein